MSQSIAVGEGVGDDKNSSDEVREQKMLVSSSSLSEHEHEEHHKVVKRLRCGIWCLKCLLCENCQCKSCKGKGKDDDDEHDDPNAIKSDMESALDSFARHILAFKDVGDEYSMSAFSVLTGLKRMMQEQTDRVIDTADDMDIEKRGCSTLSIENLEEILIYNRIATAVYGKKVLLVVKGPNHKAISDFASFLSLSGLTADQVVKSRFDSAPFRPSYAIVVNKELKRVILAVRGTLEVDDILTDVIGESSEIRVPSGPVVGSENYSDSLDLEPRQSSDSDKFKCIGYGHAGMLKSAEWLRDNILSAALEKIDDLNANAEVEGGKYRLAITGHSLGGGVATLLSVLVKNDMRYDAYTKDNGLKCVVFAPPPSLDYDLSVAAKADSFIISIANRFDFVPNLNVHTVFALRSYMVKAKGKGKSKNEGGEGEGEGEGEGGSGTTVIESKNGVAITPRKRKHVKTIEEKKRLFLGGRVFHIPRTYTLVEEAEKRFCGIPLKGKGKGSKKTALVTLCEVDANSNSSSSSSEFQTIHLHSKMVWHHMPWLYEAAVEKVISQMKEKEASEPEVEAEAELFSSEV